MSLPIVAVSVELLDSPYYDGVKRCQLFHAYLDCLRSVGLAPILLPPDAQGADLDAILAVVDGILLSGGDDLNLSLDGGPAPLAECKPVPAVQQQALMRTIAYAREKNLPLLGICLGMQAMAISQGAELIQHMPNHQQHTAGTEHSILVSRDGNLKTALGGGAHKILSYHHQALSTVAAPLQIVAAADDGTIEAVEDPNLNYYVGVQWHPEKTPNSTSSRALFEGFAEAVRQQRNKIADK
ncbi:MAG: gamma-glutamyl-gamma-aminobutyrate hydrolase family protein [Planctomycetota bacterium]|jgi:putative glutamine amidotransferase|nr:gamma-glutamyl-gamma-aminobutyrate hydrolase family protein [Planctomycetota bacterium]